MQILEVITEQLRPCSAVEAGSHQQPEVVTGINGPCVSYRSRLAMLARPAPLQWEILVPAGLSASRSGFFAQQPPRRSTPLSTARNQLRVLKKNLLPGPLQLSCGNLTLCLNVGDPQKGQVKPGRRLPEAPWETSHFHHGDSRLHPCTTRLCTLQMAVGRATRFGSKINADSFMEVQWTRDPGTEMAKCWPSLEGPAAQCITRNHGYSSDIDGLPVAGQSMTNHKPKTASAFALAFPLASHEVPGHQCDSRACASLVRDLDMEKA